MRDNTFVRRVGIHGPLLILMVWSIVPFLWAIQTSIKFTRDVSAKTPVLWGYETTSSAYNSFWFKDDDIGMWSVAFFILGVAIIAGTFGAVGRSRQLGWQPYGAAALALGVTTWLTVWLWGDGDGPGWKSFVVYIAAFVVAPAVAGSKGLWPRTGWPWYLLSATTIVLALWVFPHFWRMEDEYDFLINSLVVTVLTMLISLSIGLLAGYGLARYTGISGAVILIVALGFRALPRSAFVLPYFFGATRIDSWLESSGVGTWDFPLIDFPFIDELAILDTRLAIVLALVAVNQPFTIWMFRSYFMDVPKEMEEAAMMDGATRFEAFWRVIVPIMWPAIIATGLFTLLLAYNEYLFVRVLAPTEWTLPVAIVSLTGGESSRTVTEAAAASVSITLPIVIVIILFQKHLVKGLGAGAVKG